jgi:6-phosphogluconolactonase
MSESQAAEKPSKLLVAVGTYSTRGSKGIYLFHMDLATGKLTPTGTASELENPSFVAIHPSRKYLYAVGEVGSRGSRKGGLIGAFALDARAGKATFLNQESSVGDGPCHLVVDRAGKNVLAANYGGGSICSVPIHADGKLGEHTAFVQHTGGSVDQRRQGAPHAHSINLDAANHYAFCADLGLDKVLVYRFDSGKGTLVSTGAAGVVEPGSGPRHFAFHPNGKTAYVINEMKSTVTAFSYDSRAGTLKALQTISTLPNGFSGNTSTAEVQVTPDGKYLYGSNRGHDSLAIFKIDPKTGLLTAVGHQKTMGRVPRNFGIDPTGTYVLACNQETDDIFVFKIDHASGQLRFTGEKAQVPAPVCVKMVPVE